MTKHPFVSTTDSSLRTLSSTCDKDASTYTSLLFDFVATGLRTIQFLFFFRSIRQRRRRFANATAYVESVLFREESTEDLLDQSRDQMNKTLFRQVSEPKARRRAMMHEREKKKAVSGANGSEDKVKSNKMNEYIFGFFRTVWSAHMPNIYL
jgi:hypothetical protein